MVINAQIDDFAVPFTTFQSCPLTQFTSCRLRAYTSNSSTFARCALCSVHRCVSVNILNNCLLFVAQSIWRSYMKRVFLSSILLWDGKRLINRTMPKLVWNKKKGKSKLAWEQFCTILIIYFKGFSTTCFSTVLEFIYLHLSKNNEDTVNFIIVTFMRGIGRILQRSPLFVMTIVVGKNHAYMSHL